jgi:hypothetical protein
MKPLKQIEKRQTANSSSYVYAIRVDGVVRYIGKGRNGRIYSHMIEALRTANKPGVKIANLSPHFRKKLVSAIRRGAKIKEKIVTANLSADAAYAIERHMIGSLHKNHPGQLWNTIDERFMSPEYLPDDWSNPVDPLYKVRRPLTPVRCLNGEDPPRFFGQVIPNVGGSGRHAAVLAGAPSPASNPTFGPRDAGLRLEAEAQKTKRTGGAAMTEKSTTAQAGANSSEPPKKSAPTEDNGTMHERLMKRSSTNPRIKVAKPSGKGFVMLGTKP